MNASFNHSSKINFISEEVGLRYLLGEAIEMINSRGHRFMPHQYKVVVFISRYFHFIVRIGKPPHLTYVLLGAPIINLESVSSPAIVKAVGVV